tara:strand:+ start:308 stop:550 length:243 start_codon:yes stop_codon:yes gene_type:complete
MNTKISKDWFANVLSRFIAYEMDEQEQQKFLERLISSWMYTNKNWNLYEVSMHLNLPHFGEPITKLESDPFWKKELNTIK